MPPRNGQSSRNSSKRRTPALSVDMALFSRAHLVKPPSSTATFSRPATLQVHATRVASARPKSVSVLVTMTIKDARDIPDFPKMSRSASSEGSSSERPLLVGAQRLKGVLTDPGMCPFWYCAAVRISRMLIRESFRFCSSQSVVTIGAISRDHRAGMERKPRIIRTLQSFDTFITTLFAVHAAILK